MASVPSPTDLDPLARARSLLDENRPAEAASVLKRLIESGRAGLLARVQFVRALAAANDINSALEVARETSVLFPAAAAAALGLGEVLLKAGQLPASIAEFQRALRIDPRLNEARYRLGLAWLEAGEPDKALHAFQEIEPEEGSRDIAARIAQAERMQTAPRSSPNYVRHLFDQFSADYDVRMLGQLAYAAPRILRELMGMVMARTAKSSLDILDLGCGTGLAGAEFRPLARRLDGVDLSPAMIGKARARGIYEALQVADIEAVPFAGPYDLAIAADTLVYLGDLAPVFRSLHGKLKPDGYFLFTVEADTEADYALGPKRRWRHSEAYLRRQADCSGFEVAGLLACSPRREAGIPVPGFAVALRKAV